MAEIQTLVNSMSAQWESRSQILSGSAVDADSEGFVDRGSGGKAMSAAVEARVNDEMPLIDEQLATISRPTSTAPRSAGALGKDRRKRPAEQPLS